MMIAPVDQRDFDVSSLERACRGDARKSCADYQNTSRPSSRIRDDRRFRRKAFGENCAHLFYLKVSAAALPPAVLDTAACRAILEW
jgi:hypothetical protein